MSKERIQFASRWMKICIFGLAAAAGCVAAAPDQSKAKPCSAPEYSRFDFWVGDWDVFDIDSPSTVVARTRVDLILDGCVLREDYQGADGHQGQSFTSYDASRKVWHQSWVTNRGESLTIEGGAIKGDAIVLNGADLVAGREREVRGTWKREGKDSVRETAVVSMDGGKIWTPWFDILFRPHQALLSQGDPPPSLMYSRTEAGMATDEITLRQLNDQYVEAFMKADTDWYRAHLKDDFVCIESDGSVLNKREFLVNAAKGSDVTAYKLARVDVRIYDNVALVQATGLFTTKDGSSGTSRYTDVYVRDGGSWKAVSAQITRVPAS